MPLMLLLDVASRVKATRWSPAADASAAAAERSAARRIARERSHAGGSARSAYSFPLRLQADRTPLIAPRTQFGLAVLPQPYSASVTRVADKSMMKAAPPPSRASTHTRPRCTAAISATIASPRPAPPGGSLASLETAEDPRFTREHLQASDPPAAIGSRKIRPDHRISRRQSRRSRRQAMTSVA